MGTRNILKKITVKTCGAKPDLEKLIEHKKVHGPSAVLPLLEVIGIASDWKPGSSEIGGDFIKLLGMFKAVNLATGEVFESGACILPGAASDLVYGALASVKPNGGSVEFAFRIGVRWEETAATKYVYTVEQIYTPERADPLAALEARLENSNVRALKAPEPTAAVAKKR